MIYKVCNNLYLVNHIVNKAIYIGSKQIINNKELICSFKANTLHQYQIIPLRMTSILIRWMFMIEVNMKGSTLMSYLKKIIKMNKCLLLVILGFMNGLNSLIKKEILLALSTKRSLKKNLFWKITILD
jgi:hypothetical protein